MAFEGLTDKLQGAFKKLNGKGKLSEADVKAAMREVRMALLEADVNFLVVKDFVKKVTERAVGADIMQSLTPGQQVIKIVNEELTALMGGTNAKLTYSPQAPTIYMMAGLQGAGKTTMCAKLGNLLKKDNKKPLLVACDVYRPAAIKQLQVVGEQVGVEVFERGQGNPVEIAKEAVDYARYYGRDPVIIDTAGRLHIDAALMQELRDVRAAVKPKEILLVVDAMTGQDAVNVAKTFNEELGVDGVILTKLDGDTRGGAAISVRAVTGKPIKFSGIGEKLTDIEPFHPDRMASRILGMGDVLTLIDKAQENFDEQAAIDLTRKMANEQDGLHHRPAQDDPRRGQQDQGRGHRRGGRGQGPEEERGHHPVHDPHGAPQPGHPERLPQAPRGRRQRYHRAGREPAAEAVRPGPHHDEEHDGQRQARQDAHPLREDAEVLICGANQNRE